MHTRLLVSVEAKHLEGTGSSLVARITECMRSLINPSLKSYVDALHAKNRVAAHDERITQVTIKVSGVSVDMVQDKALENIWIRRRKPEMNG